MSGRSDNPPFGLCIQERDVMLELFTYKFIVNAVFAAVFAAVSCGIIGTYIVTKRIVSVSGGIAHASFGGVGIGYWMGINPVIGAAVFGIASALGIQFFSKRVNIRKDSLIGIMWSFGMATGIIFIFLTPGYAPNLMTYLFGNILTVSNADIMMMLGISMFTVVFFAVFFDQILYISFDEEYMTIQGVSTSFINNIIWILIALTVVINMRVVGIILVISLLTIPQATAELFSRDFKHLMLFSMIFAFIAVVSGLVISYRINIPSGAAIIFSSIIIFVILDALKRLSIIGRRSLTETR